MAPTHWLAPTKPANAPDTNFIQTAPGLNFLVTVRLYGTGVEFFDQSWKLTDLEKIN